jgi:hypothetical protein
MSVEQASNNGRSQPASRTSTVLAILAAAGVALYGVDYYLLYGFYNELGVTPDDLGLTYAGVLSRTAMAVGVVLLYGTPVLAVIAALLTWFFRRKLKALPVAEQDNLRTWSTSFAVACVFLFLVTVIVVASRRPQIAAVWLALLVAAAIAVAFRLRRILQRRRQPGIDFLPWRVTMIAWLLLVIFTIPLLGATGGVEELAKTGDLSVVHNNATLALIGKVKCVELVWVATPPNSASVPEAGHPVLYLGAKEGMVMVLDTNPPGAPDPRLHRIAMENVVVSEVTPEDCKRSRTRTGGPPARFLRGSAQR